VTATISTSTSGVTVTGATASYGTMLAGANATSSAPHFSALLGSGLACGSVITYNVAIHANEGDWTGSFTQTVGSPLTGGGTVLSESFTSGIPGTWTIVDGGSGGGAAATWTSANPGARSIASPLVSPIAIIDSDNAGSTSTQDEQLISPVLNLSTATTVQLAFDHWFKWYSSGLSEIGDVDVKSSLTGGNWTNVFRNQNASTPASCTGTSCATPDHRVLDITAQAAGASNVQVRFHYYQAQFEWWWEVDNVTVTYTAPAGCNMHTCSAPSCGNGVIEAGEQCDDSNTQNGDCCSSSCQYEASGSSCGSAGSNTCTAPDTCNATGVCQANNAANGTSCSDGNACTQTDTCQSGVCTGANPVTCSASDQCHDAGVCNTATGVCSNPAKTNGSTCSDGNACTQTDTCQSGTCTGASPVLCFASDQCHDLGACDTATGVCSNPAKPNGASCDDGNACTQSDSCQSGACTGANPVTCTASDQCHDLGTCDTATGVCSNPAKPNGASCDDGSA
jgi:cysteine-rich repeat protein